MLYLCNLEEENSEHINDSRSHQFQVAHLPILNGHTMNGNPFEMRNLEVGILDHILDGIGVANLDGLEQLVDKILPQELLIVNVVIWGKEGVVNSGIDERSFVAVCSKHDGHLHLNK